ncbi:MAG: ribulose-phosphate 3-epimerase [Bacteriovoracaceae bacterium]|nr:ribulose-phosphate 3-epimerase [Bacteriovoracaceae bacterium]
MNIVAPSILSASFLDLRVELTQLNKSENLWLHLDIMDSHFVPNLTFGKPVLTEFHKLSKHPLDAHFMVTNPEFFIKNFKDIKIHNFTFHLEATQDCAALIKQAKKYYPSVGISIKPATAVEEIKLEWLKELDLVLLMSVNPGFSGQKFMPSVYDKITYLADLRKKHKCKFQIQVDGGVDASNAKKLREHGADNLVSGSFIFSEPNKNYELKIKELR